jgi:hypothetical protein
MGLRPMYILENWFVIARRNSSGDEVLFLSGQVHGHARFHAGEVITTSSLTEHRFEQEKLVVLTRHGSEYMLGRPKASAMFAKQRLLRYLQRPKSQAGAGDSGKITDISGRAVQDRMPGIDSTNLDYGPLSR